MNKDNYIKGSGLLLCLLSVFIFFPLSTISQNWSWAKGIHTSNAEFISDVAVDPSSGNIVAVGTYTGSLNAYYPGTTLIGGGLVAKYDPSGNVIWSFSIGDNADDGCNAVAIDASGNIYVTGYFQSAAEFKGNSLFSYFVNANNPIGKEMFVAKYNSAGQIQWVRQGGGSQDDEGYSVAVNTTRLFVTGYFTNSANFSGIPSGSNQSNQNAFFVSYDLSGNPLWEADAGDGVATYGRGITADANNVYIIGDFKGASLGIYKYNFIGVMDWTLANTNPTKEDIFLLSLSVNGPFNWADSICSSGSDFGRGIEQNTNGLFVTGSTSSNATFPGYAGNPVATGAQGLDFFVARFDKTNGNANWVSSEPGTADEEGTSISSDTVNTICVSGYFKSSISFNGGPTIVSSGNEEVFVANYSLTGFNWVKQAGANGKDIPHGISANSFGDVYVGGEYESNAAFGANVLTADSPPNMFIAKIGCLPLAYDTILSPPQTVCSSQIPTPLNGSVPSGSSPPYTYLWQQSPDNSSWSSASGTNNTQNYSPPTLTANTYYRRLVSTSGNCAGSLTSTSVLITVNQAPTAANAGADQIICRNTTTLTANNPASGTGVWSLVSGTGTITSVNSPTTSITSLGTGTNSFVWNISNGVCPVSTDTVKIKVNPSPTVTANSTASVVCSGTAVTLTGSGASTYTWTGGVTNGVAFTPGSTQTYTVTGTDINSCSGSATIVVNVNSLPGVTANATATTICTGQSVTLSGGGASTYTWTGGITNGVAFTPSSTQTYTVTGTDANGCINSASKTITVNTLPAVTANATATLVCNGQNVTLSGGGASTYTWTGGITNGVAFTPSSTQTYTVTGTDVNGCSGSASKTITVNSLPTVTANATSTVVCNGTSVTLTGGGAITYTWTNGVTNGVAFTPSSTQTYTVTGTDGNGCSNSAVKTITVNSLPAVTANATPTVVCTGQSVTLTGGGASTYTWTGGVANGVAFTPSSTQTYTVTGTDINGCVNSATKTVNVNTLPTVVAFATNTVVCSGTPVTLTASGANTYTWSNGVTGGVPFTPAVTQTYTVAGTDANGCKNSTTVSITVDQPPSTSVAGSAQTICSTTTTLSANTPVTGNGSWSVISGGGIITTANSPASSVTNLTTGLNTLMWTISNGVCTASTSTVSIQVNAPPTNANAGSNQSLCTLSSTTLNANTPVTGTGAWSVVSGTGTVSSTNSPNTAVSGLTTGQTIFMWTITNGVCPASTSTVSVQVDAMPSVANAGPDVSTYVSASTMAANTPTVGTGAWSVTSGSGSFSSASNPASSVSDLAFGENVFTWTISNGSCPASTDEVIITLHDLVIPNGFSPNGDGINDNFEIPGITQYSNVKLEVFNRWGNLVFESSDYKNGWGGKNTGGEDLTDDTYFYTLDIPNKKIFKGYLVLKRK
ncbi:MAG: T9SS type B sorting domain-containing protein [Bacteroidia bacterium]